MMKRLLSWFKEGPSILLEDSERLLEDNKRLRQHNDALRAENDELRNENSRLQARNAELTRLEDENQMLKAQIHDRERADHEKYLAAHPPTEEIGPDAQKLREEMIEKTVKEYARTKGTNLKKGELQRLRENLERMPSLAQITAWYEVYKMRRIDSAK